MREKMKWILPSVLLLLLVVGFGQQIPEVNAQSETVLFRVNNGGPEIAATDSGPAWSEDQSTNTANGAAQTGTPSPYFNFAANNEDKTFGVNSLPGQFVNITILPDDIFKTERYYDQAAAMQWDFPVVPGTYRVNLYMAEIWSNGQNANARLFDIAVEGVLENEDFSIFSTFGGYTADVLSYEVTVTDGTLDLDLSKGSANNPKVSAIEVIQLSTTGNTFPSVEITAPADASAFDEGTTISFTATASDAEDTTVTVNWSSDLDGVLGTGDALDVSTLSVGTHTITASVTDSGTLTSEDSVTVTVNSTEPLPVGTVLYRVNVGGPEVAAADSTEPAWGQDQGGFGTANNSPYLSAHSTGQSLYNGNSGNAHPGSILLTDPSLNFVPGAPTAVFNTERYDAASNPEALWQFDINPGTTVEVRLLFAELFSGIDAPGQRVFDVEVEGIIPAGFDSIDPFAIDGPKGAFVRFALVTVTDGTLDIEFIHDVENPALKGIEIVVADSQSNNTPTLLLTSATDANPLTATANDAEDGDLSANINWNSSIDGDFATGANADTSTLSPGTHTITASVTDNGNSTDTFTLEIVVDAPVNTAPVATDDTANTDEDTPASIDVLNNDTDADLEDTLTIESVTQPSNGSTTIDNGQILYTPAMDFFGTDSFDYTINDGNEGTDTATVTITVDPVNDAPIAVDDSTITDQNVPVVITVLDNDTDVDNDTLSVQSVTQGSNGTVGTDGTTITYTPNTDFFGNDSFSYTITDGDLTATADVQVTVNQVVVELIDMCINIGGTAGTAFGRDFIGDNSSGTNSPYFTQGGQKFGNPTQGATEGNLVPLSGTALTGYEEDIFQTERFGGAPEAVTMILELGAGNNLPTSLSADGTLPNGNYIVDLYFAEIFVGVQSGGLSEGVGSRVFSVALEGTSVVTDLDIFAEYGPLTPFVISNPVTVSDNSLTVEFNATEDNAKISAICLTPTETVNQDTTSPTIELNGDDPVELSVGGEYVEAGVTVSDDTDDDIDLRVTIDDSAVSTSQAGSYDVNYTVIDRNGNTATATRTVNVTALNTAPTIDPIADVTLDEGQDVIVDVIVTDNEADATVSLLIDDVDPSAYTFENNTLTWLTPPVGEYSATVTADDGEFSATEAFTITINEVIVGVPSALVEITPDGGLGASTYSGSSFQITNNSTEGITIESVTFDLSTGILPEMVFDPVGAGGDATSSCLTPNSGAVATGFVAPSDPCVDPFSVPRNGGFDVMTVNFTDFGETEQFFFTTDIDPNSIQGVPGAGNAGAVSGYELVGSTITVTFSDGSTIVSSFYEDGSIGGAQAVVTTNATSAPSIVADGVTSPAIVNDLNQTIVLTGTPGDNYSLLQMDTRLYIASGNPPFDVSPTQLPFYANEAMAGKNVLNGVIDGDGIVEIPVTLLTTAGASGTPDGGLNYFIAVTSSASYAVDQQVSQTSNTIILKYEEGIPEALVEITPTGNLGASTFSASSFQITNNSTAGITIDSVTFDLSTGILPDMVFDPVGAGGDATASCLTPNSGATATGFIVPTDPCVDPFSVPRNGGFDVMTVDFSDFGAGEQFLFTTDVDPNSIQGVPGAGNAGAVSGYELSGATITVTFSNGAVVTSSLYEMGNLSGAQAVVANDATSAPSIVADGVTSPAIVNDLNQTIVLTGTPGDNYSLLQMDTRLYIASGNPPFDVSPTELPFYANEAMAGKNVLNGVIDGDGTVEIPVTLLTTAGAGDTPDGGLNYFIAVTSSTPYAVDQQVSQTSNTVILKYEEALSNVAPEIFFLTDVTNGISVQETQPASVQLSVTDVDGNLDVVDAGGVDVDFASVSGGQSGIYIIDFTPDMDDSGIYTITVTATDTEGLSTSESFILTVTEEPMATLIGTFTMQGRNDLSTSGLTVTMYSVDGVEEYSFTPTVSTSGEFVLTGINPGTYQVMIDTSVSLQLVEVVTLTAGNNSIAMGQLRVGDANGDNVVSSLDFSLLATSFNTQQGGAGYNAAADFNGDGLVSSLDFSLLASNFNTAGDSITP